MIKPGPFVRSLLPERVEAWAADAYRSVFVDLGEVTQKMAEHLPPNASCLDIGGGDGMVLNHLLDKRPDINVAMVDIAPQVGRLIDPSLEDRIERHPGTTIKSHVAHLAGAYDAAIISDVLHHVPAEFRQDFVGSIAEALRPGAVAMVKDVQPGHPLATLGYWADKYISGDRDVALVPMEDASALLLAAGLVECEETGLLALNPPNYMLAARMPEASASSY